MADDNEVDIKVSANTEQLESSLDGAREQLGKLKESAESVAESFRSMLEIAGISLGLEGIKSWVESMGQLGNSTETFMAKLGIGAQTVGEFSGVAKLAGLSIDGVATSFERMALNVQRSTRSAFNPAAEGLKVLGISAKDLINLPADQYFGKLADAVGKFNPSMNLTTALMSVGGRGVASLLPILLGGKEHFEQMSAAIQATGATLTDLQAHNFAATDEKIGLLGLSIQGFGIKVFDTLRPAIDAAIEAFTRFVQSIKADDIRNAVSTIANYLIGFAQQVANVFIGLGGISDSFQSQMSKMNANVGITLTGFAARFYHFGEDVVAGLTAAINKIGELLGYVGRFFQTVGGYLGEFFGWLDKINNFQLSGGIAATNKESDESQKRNQFSSAQVDLFGGAGKNTVDDDSADKRKKQVDAVNSWADSLRNVTADLLKTTEATNTNTNSVKQNAAAMNMNGAQQLQAQLKQIDTQIASWKTYYDQTKTLDTDEVTRFAMTEGQKTADLRSVLDIRWQMDQEYYNKEIELAGGNVAMVAELERKKIADLDAINKEYASLQSAQLKQSVTEWEGAVSTLSSSWNSQIKGLLAGTTSWATAMKNIVSDLVIKIIEKLEEIAVVKPLTSILSSSLGAPSEMLGSITKMITSLLGPMAAGFTTFFAPILGPAAPAAGAALAASEIATVAKLEVGTNYVPQTGLAMLHQGEAVIPASQNMAPFSGGSSVNINGPVIGTTAFVNSMIQQIARGMSSYQRLTPSYGAG